MNDMIPEQGDEKGAQRRLIENALKQGARRK